MQQDIDKLRSFVRWFENNFADEMYCKNTENEDGTLNEVWILYIELPEYLGAVETLEKLENRLTSPH